MEDFKSQTAEVSALKALIHTQTRSYIETSNAYYNAAMLLWIRLSCTEKKKLGNHTRDKSCSFQIPDINCTIY